MLDTHAHLCDPVFDLDRREILTRAETAGIVAVVSVSENLSDANRNIELAERHARLLPAAGLYPTILDPGQAETMYSLIRQERKRLAAIGEVGLDYWMVQEETEREVQRHIFENFITLSLELGLPLNVHSRSAGRHAVAMLLERGAQKVQLHAFDGKAASALPAVEAGYFFSIPPSIIRSRQKQKLVKKLPLSCLLLETDSPVLGPSSEKRNEPSFATVSLHAIAELKNVDEAEVAAVIRENTHRLYGDFEKRFQVTGSDKHQYGEDNGTG